MGVPLRSLNVTDFLAWESQQFERHEFVRGEVFAMVGGTRGRHRIIANLVRHLGNHLEDSPCQVFSEAMKVRVGDEAALYPDVVVTCDRQFRADDPVLHEPVVVVEVPSPSTQRYDRSEKFAFGGTRTICSCWRSSAWPSGCNSKRSGLRETTSATVSSPLT